MNTSFKKLALASLIATAAFGLTLGSSLATPIQSDMKPAKVMPFGWLQWNNVRVDVRAGVKLLLPNGNPVRASQIRVFANDIGWQASYSYPAVGFVTQPGNNNTGYGGIIVFQPGGSSCLLPSSAIDGNNSVPCNFNNQSDIYVMVNDGIIGSGNDGHDDNGGSFDLFAKVTAP